MRILSKRQAQELADLCGCEIYREKVKKTSRSLA